MRATALITGAPAGARRAIIRRVGAEVELVNLRWGLRPAVPDPIGGRFVRAEGRSFATHRCLVPTSEFQVVRNDKAYRVSLDGGNFFYLAGIWQPAVEDWPDAFAVLTVDANREVARYQSRQGVLLRRNRHMAWLDATQPDDALLTSPPDGIFRITAADGREQESLPF